MRHLLWTAAAFAFVAAGPATAGEMEFKPIDTNKLVVKPTKAAADLSAATIKLVGNSMAGSIEENGEVKAINNLLGVKWTSPRRVLPGRSPLAAPTVAAAT